MKFKNIYKIAALVVLCLVLQSKKNGPGSQSSLRVTGAPGDGTCANSSCHTQGSFEPSVSLELLDGSNPVTKYEPGKSYTLKVTNTPGTGAGTPSRYGFQAVALDSLNKLQAGDWGTPGAGKHIITLSSRKYVEHSSPATSGVFEVPWIAPASGKGTVVFHSASLASNNDNSTTGDGTANNSLSVQESNVSSTSSAQREYASLQVIPNPVNETLNLEIISRSSGNYYVRIMNVAGVAVKTEQVFLQIGKNQKTFGVNELAPGLYVVQLCGTGHLAATQMLKK